MQSLADCTAILAGDARRVNTKPRQGAETLSESSELSEPEYLSEYSPKDKPWDVHRSQTDDVAAIYSTAEEFERYAQRMELCSGRLGFAWAAEKDCPGVLTLKLRNAHFCRVRHCPTCQWRRSLMWVARFLQALPHVLEEHPKARFVFATFTVRNIPTEELRGTLRHMNQAWHRLVARKDYKLVHGWIRTTEVTRGSDGSAHPHFHVLMMVPPGYFKGTNYIKQERWTELWREALRAEYTPIVDVRAVKGSVTDAARETLKYAVKPSDMKSDPGWVLEITRQLHKLRFVATGGVLKDILREDDESEQDLLIAGEDSTDEDSEEASLFFDWQKPKKRYARSR